MCHQLFKQKRRHSKVCCPESSERVWQINQSLLCRSILDAEGTRHSEAESSSLFHPLTFIHQHEVCFDLQCQENCVALTTIEVWHHIWSGRWNRNYFKPRRMASNPLLYCVGRPRVVQLGHYRVGNQNAPVEPWQQTPIRRSGLSSGWERCRKRQDPLEAELAVCFAISLQVLSSIFQPHLAGL